MLNTEAAQSARGDSPEVAGRSLRAIPIAQRRFRRRIQIRLAGHVLGVGTVVAAAAMLLILPTGTAVRAGFAAAAFVAVTVAAAMYPRQVFAGAGAALSLAWTAHLAQQSNEPLMSTYAGSVVMCAGLYIVHSTRRARRSTWIPTALIVLSAPAAVTVMAVVGAPHGIWLVSLLATVVACWAWRSEFEVTVAAWRAAARSQIRYVAGVPHAQRGDVAMDPDNLARGAAAEVETARVLTGLGPRWWVLHSRALHGTAADADHIVIGPAGVLLLDSKKRSGTFDCEPWMDEHGVSTRWTFNGRELPANLVRSALFEADRIGWAFRADTSGGQPVPTVLVIHGATMNVPWGEAEFEETVVDPDTQEEVVVGVRTVTLVAVEHLLDYLRQLPERHFTEPSGRERRRGLSNGLSEDEIVAAAQERYVADLAAVSDHLFIPAAS